MTGTHAHPPEPLAGAGTAFTLDPGMTHLNHGSVGAVPMSVRLARQRITDELESDPRGFFKSRVERTTAAREVICEFLGLEPDRTALVRNIASGVAQVLAALKLRSGEEVITTNHGYPAVGFNVDAWVRRGGVKHRGARLPLNPTAGDVTAGVLAEVTQHTRLVIIDHVTSSTARLFSLGEVIAELRRREIPVLVDAAHVPGHLPAHVLRTGADFWVGNLHKWAFAPRGTALLSVREPWVRIMDPLVESWAHEDGFPVATEFNGTDDFTGWLAAVSGIDFLRQWGVRRVRDHNSRLVHYGQKVLAEALDVAVDDPESGPLAMRVVPLPAGVATTPGEARELENAARKRLRTELAVTTFEGQGLVRIAAQMYNTAADYERLAERLPALLARPR